MYQLSLCERELARALEMPLYFGDSLPSLRKERWLNKSKTLGSIYQDVTGKQFMAHDALEDSTALQVIMEDERLKACLSVTHANSIPIKTAFLRMKEKAETSLRVLTFKGNLNSILSPYMIEKMAKTGLTYHAVKNAHSCSGAKGVVDLMTGAITSNAEILTKIIFYFNKQQ
ncbi:MAG: hypothetical protein DSY43_02685 [Gammaproteobacteria bacterium]|nr:MAG: hypothetical protein DSY43_02685 [Gammaproteobacteria bacterium]